MTKIAVRKTGNGEQKAERALASRGPSFHPVENLRREMDRLFEDFFGGGIPAPFTRRMFDWDIEPFGDLTKRMGAVTPRIDVHESDNAVTIEAELPGMDEDNIDLTLSENLLTLQGEKKDEKEEEKDDYHVSERHYGSFKRTFRVPETIDVEKVVAKFKKGVLTVTMPKSAKARKEAGRSRLKQRESLMAVRKTMRRYGFSIRRFCFQPFSASI